MHDLNGLLPFIHHESANVAYCSCMIANEHGNDTEWLCNVCGVVLGVMNIAILMDLISLTPATGSCHA
jgi:hypothetical protein